MFVHHVFFWLRSELSADEIALFETSVSTLLNIDQVRYGDVGTPSSTNRPVIERGYTYSLLLVFENKDAHDAYQPHPIHQQFVSECSHLWDRVLIYDSETYCNVARWA